jgi:hypothetical protein
LITSNTRHGPGYYPYILVDLVAHLLVVLLRDLDLEDQALQLPGKLVLVRLQPIRLGPQALCTVTGRRAQCSLSR